MNQIALVVILAGGLSGRPVDLSGWMSMALAGSGEIIQADAGLEQADANPAGWIQTVRGVGYSFRRPQDDE